MKKIYVVAVLLLVAMLVLTAAIPKPGPNVILTLKNRMINEEAHISLSGLTNFYTYYLTAKAYDVEVKFPAESPKIKKTTYEVRADYYETTVYVCDIPGRSGVINLTRNVQLTFPLCDKAGKMNMGEPTQEKISTARFFPGYWDPTGYQGEDLTKPRYLRVLAGQIKGSDVACVQNVAGPLVFDPFSCQNVFFGDGYDDGSISGNFAAIMNGAQVRWALDFYNWDNGGADVWH